MRIIGVQSRVSPFLIAVVLLLQLLPALATGQPDAQQATTQGSRVPGMPVPSTDTTKDKRRGPVEVTFTKWPTTGLPPLPAVPGRTLFQGFVGGDLGDGDFVGEVLDSKVSTACTAFGPPCTPGITPPTITGSIGALHAIYEVQVGETLFHGAHPGREKPRHRRSGLAGRRHPCRVEDRGAGACGIPDDGRLRRRTCRPVFSRRDSR